MERELAGHVRRYPCPIRRLPLNTSKKPGDDGGIGLAEAIAALRDELLKARAAGAGSDIQLPVESMTVELRVAATRSKDGRAGFKVPVIEVELGGGMAAGSETGQTVTVVFGAPVDSTGAVVKVAEATDEVKD
jgi:Trypsin-co-occurring domain 2